MGNINELVSGLTGVATQAFNKLGAGAAAKAYLQTDDSPTNILGRAQDFITNTLSNKPLPTNTSPPVEEGRELQPAGDDSVPATTTEATEPTGETAETSFGGEAGDTVQTATTGATEGAEGAAGAADGAADAGEGIMGTIGEIGAGLDLTGIGSTVGLVLGAVATVGTAIDGLVQLIEGHHKQAQNTSVNLSQLPNVSFTPGVN
jgi:hypothetical protein